MATNNKSVQSTGWAGWVFFAGVMMALSGLFSAFAGLVAIFKHSVYVVSPHDLIVFNYTQWGWIHFILGIILVLSASSLMSGKLWGRFVGLLLATLSALANFAFLGAYPIWSITVIIVDVLIIYAIAVHGNEMQA